MAGRLLDRMSISLSHELYAPRFGFHTAQWASILWAFLYAQADLWALWQTFGLGLARISPIMVHFGPFIGPTKIDVTLAPADASE